MGRQTHLLMGFAQELALVPKSLHIKAFLFGWRGCDLAKGAWPGWRGCALAGGKV